MKISPVTLTGKQAQLVPLSTEHVEGLFEAGNDQRIWSYIPSVMNSVDDMQRVVEKALKSQESGSELPFTIIDLETNKIIGSTRFYDIDRQNRGLEIGWTWLNPSVWRTRINTECKYLLLQHCFETLGTIRVALRTDLRNERSQRAIERLGAKKEGIFRKHRIMPDGYIRDTVYYSIIDDEWPEVKARLEEFLREA